MDLAFEAVKAGDVWNIYGYVSTGRNAMFSHLLTSLGGKTSGDNKVGSFSSPAICSLHRPLARLGVKFSAGDDSLKGTVLAQVQHFVHVVKIALKLAPVWIVRAPCPVLVDFRNGKFVNWHWAVNAGTGIAVLHLSVKQVLA